MASATINYDPAAKLEFTTEDIVYRRDGANENCKALVYKPAGDRAVSSDSLRFTAAPGTAVIAPTTRPSRRALPASGVRRRIDRLPHGR